MNFARSMVLAVVVCTLGACATPGPVLTKSVGAIRTGLNSVGDQSAAAFESTNTAARQFDIDRVAELPAPNLVESDFPLAISDADRAQWSNSLGILDAYLAALQSLVDSKRSEETAGQFDAIANQLRGGAIGADVPGPVAAAFSTFAGALVQAKAERTATDIMRKTDPAFNEVMAGMAATIGVDDRTGLRQTVRVYWSTKLGFVRADYAAVTGTGEAATNRRRAAATQFAAFMRARDADLRNLGAIRTAMLALGEAHAAAARGNQGDALLWIGRISRWLDDIKSRAESAQPAKKEQP